MFMFIQFDKVADQTKKKKVYTLTCSAFSLLPTVGVCDRYDWGSAWAVRWILSYHCRRNLHLNLRFNRTHVQENSAEVKL